MCHTANNVVLGAVSLYISALPCQPDASARLGL